MCHSGRTRAIALTSRHAVAHPFYDGPGRAKLAGKTKLGFAGLGIMGQAMSKRLIDAGYELHVWNRDPAKSQQLAAQGAKVRGDSCSGCRLDTCWRALFQERCVPGGGTPAPQVAGTPKELASRADITFAMLSDPPAALAVATGKDGITAGNRCSRLCCPQDPHKEPQRAHCALGPLQSDAGTTPARVRRCHARPRAGLGPGKGYVDVSTVDGATSSSIAAAVRATGAHFLEAPVSGSKGPAINGQLIFLTAGAGHRRCRPAAMGHTGRAA